MGFLVAVKFSPLRFLTFFISSAWVETILVPPSSGRVVNDATLSGEPQSPRRWLAVFPESSFTPEPSRFGIENCELCPEQIGVSYSGPAFWPADFRFSLFYFVIFACESNFKAPLSISTCFLPNYRHTGWPGECTNGLFNAWILTGFSIAELPLDFG